MGIWLLPSRISKFLSSLLAGVVATVCPNPIASDDCALHRQAHTSCLHLVVSASRQIHWVVGNLSGVSVQLHMHVTSHKLQWLT